MQAEQTKALVAYLEAQRDERQRTLVHRDDLIVRKLALETELMKVKDDIDALGDEQTIESECAKLDGFIAELNALMAPVAPVASTTETIADEQSTVSIDVDDD